MLHTDGNPADGSIFQIRNIWIHIVIRQENIILNQRKLYEGQKFGFRKVWTRFHCQPENKLWIPICILFWTEWIILCHSCFEFGNSEWFLWIVSFLKVINLLPIHICAVIIINYEHFIMCLVREIKRRIQFFRRSRSIEMEF